MTRRRRVHWLQHAEHEGLGCIGPWLHANGFRTTRTALHEGERPPSSGDFDWLIVMGGPMNIYEHDRHPWLIMEKALIRDACVNNRVVLGICLGAQLLADVKGARVTKNREPEIGWFPLELTEEGRRSPIFNGFPDRFEVFHWHGDTFSAPAGCPTLAKSDACVNQAFAAAGPQVALQFHLELQHDDALRWLESDAPAPDRFVQTAEDMLRDRSRFAAQNALMTKILEQMAAAL
jgi:GMP synthase-like glutamine amidotransferase